MCNIIKKQFLSFLAAIMFYTRIPILFKAEYDKESFGNATKFLPLIGIIVGGFAAFIFWACSFILPVNVSILLSMIAGILVTGAFHEDGLADVCDGFGGGMTKERKLEIMKDSHIGAFGVIGLVMILGLKFFSQKEISFTILPFVIISAHSLSRFAAVILLNTMKYVRSNEESKVGSVVKKMSFTAIAFAGITGILPLLFFQNYYCFFLIIPVLFTTSFCGLFFKKHIGGYTGDCLGATQQITEVVFYLSFLILWKYI
jgi:adenosylcobinamide-GDP ribazoletransferase